MKLFRLVINLVFCIFIFVMVNSECLLALNINEIPNNQKPGTYPIEFSYEDNNGDVISTEINWTLTYPHTVISYENIEAIDAQDLLIQTSDIDIETLDSKELITKMQATAWSIQDGRGIPINRVNVKAKENNRYEYLVTFSTEKGTKTTVTLKTVTTDVLSLGEMYSYEKENEMVTQYNKIILFSGLLFLPFLYLLIVYLITYLQTLGTKRLLCKK